MHVSLPMLILKSTNWFHSNEIIEIYHKRWEIELLFKQIKQNFLLKFFYGESVNVIKIQIWATLIAILLLTVMKKRLPLSWSFSGIATMMRITFMYYMDFYTLFNHPKDRIKKLFGA